MKKKIKIPIYFGEVTIHQVKSFEKLKKKYDLINVEGIDAFAFPFPSKEGYSRYHLCFKKPSNSRVIAHECLHFINYLFLDRHIDPDLKNDESQCYLLGWIVGECHKILKINDKVL